jgi:hypothetical protein
MMIRPYLQAQACACSPLTCRLRRVLMHPNLQAQSVPSFSFVEKSTGYRHHFVSEGDLLAELRWEIVPHKLASYGPGVNSFLGFYWADAMSPR